MEPETMGGKTLSYWEDREKRIKGLIGKLYAAQESAMKHNDGNMAAEIAMDIDALIDMLVVLEWNMDIHFGEKPKEAGKGA